MTVTDASALVALILGDDPEHDRCLAVADSLTPPMATTHACLTETSYLLGRAGGWPAQRDLWSLFLSRDLIVFDLTAEETEQAYRLMKTYRALLCDYADATLVILCERTATPTVFTLDGHFYVYRLSDGAALIPIPRPRR